MNKSEGWETETTTSTKPTIIVDGFSKCISSSAHCFTFLLPTCSGITALTAQQQSRSSFFDVSCYRRALRVNSVGPNSGSEGSRHRFVSPFWATLFFKHLPKWTEWNLLRCVSISMYVTGSEYGKTFVFFSCCLTDFSEQSKGGDNCCHPSLSFIWHLRCLCSMMQQSASNGNVKGLLPF